MKNSIKDIEIYMVSKLEFTSLHCLDDVILKDPVTDSDEFWFIYHVKSLNVWILLKDDYSLSDFIVIECDLDTLLYDEFNERSNSDFINVTYIGNL
ncbi:MAG: hypothetical protein GTN36_05540 [Candidatus Aenigmarchaeota archaeon]|nr:hypothetical protein [Candidatus Aenigmarchaeota archaeon]